MKIIINYFKVATAITCFFISYSFLTMDDPGSHLIEAIFTGLISLFIGCILVYSIFNPKRKRQQKKEDRARADELKAKGIRFAAYLNHTMGLQLPENNPCQIYSYQDRIEISANGIQFNLDKNKIIDVCLRSEVEIQKQNVSSVGGAIGGAILFGSLGAMIGGRTRQKDLKTIHFYLIFTYSKIENIEYICFDATDSIMQAQNFEFEFKEYSNRQNIVVDL